METPHQRVSTDAGLECLVPPAALSAATVVLVEGISDKLALEALARRRGLRFGDDGIVVVPIGGSKNIGRYLRLFGPHGRDVRVAGLCDAAEERDYRRGLEQAGLGADLTRGDMERRGFFVCTADLEDELIRALGAAAVERVIDGQGALGAFRIFQRQPAWLGRPIEEQLRRFFGTLGGRKIASAPLLVDALDLARVPRPLALLLMHL